MVGNGGMNYYKKWQSSTIIKKWQSRAVEQSSGVDGWSSRELQSIVIVKKLFIFVRIFTIILNP